MKEDTISSLLAEGRTFPPSKAFREHANVRDRIVYREGDDHEAFWARQAMGYAWRRPWDRVLEWELPFARWFVGASLNITESCLDRHLEAGLGGKVAFHWEGEPGDRRVVTYQDLYDDVCRFANALATLGVEKGDRVTIYMGMTPELAVAMLACARLGAVHSVVFGGFSPTALRERILDSSSRVVITADGAWRRGKVVPLKANTDEALEGAPGVEAVVVLQRVGDAADVTMRAGRDHWWHDVVRDAAPECRAVETDAQDLLYILYTSGTTGKPKGIAHAAGGYMVGVGTTTKWVFDLKPEDVYWCTADIGWVTGHSYIVYGPLLNAATSVMYEGSPDHPGRDRFWELVERYGVTVFYTAPTAIRTFMKWGTEHLERHDLSSLRLLGSVGEPINPEAWVWYRQHVGGGRCPIVDTWWQTETGMIMITPLPGLTTTKPGSACHAFPGVEADVVDEEGKSVPPGAGGFLVLKKPWPAMLRGIYGNPERYREVYWSRFPGMYFAGDGARRDEDGYFWLMGRVDDIMLVSGHNISTTEVESALVDHHDVAEAAVVGRTHDVKGQAIAAFVTLKQGVQGTPELAKTLKKHVVGVLGAVARPEEIHFAADLPKTRSGKIMRRLLRDVAEGRALGDTTTLADPAVVDALRKEYEERE